jgi:hypothetical protein
VLSIVNADTDPPWFATKANVAFCDTAMAVGFVTPEKGEPVIGNNAPVERSIVNPDTLFDPPLGTYTIAAVSVVLNPPSPPPPSGHPVKSSITGTANLDNDRVLMSCPLLTYYVRYLVLV